LKLFSDYFTPTINPLRSGSSLCAVSVIPLTIIIIADSAGNTSSSVAQNYGKNFVQPASHFSLDKLCEACYNGKRGASRTLAPRPKTGAK